MGFLFAVRPRLVRLALLALPVGAWAGQPAPLDAQAYLGYRSSHDIARHHF